ncbi:hypothetical protein AAMO2058_001316300 [Amorphochlora amoebiformis]
MSKFPVYKLVWAVISNGEDHKNEQGIRKLTLSVEEERKDAYTAAFTLVHMKWRDEEESFNNNYSVWIASASDVEDEDFESGEYSNFFRNNSNKFQKPEQLKELKVEMFDESKYVCVVKFGAVYEEKDMQTADWRDIFSRSNFVYFKNESKTRPVKIMLFPAIKTTQHSSLSLKASLEGGFEGLVKAMGYIQRKSETTIEENKGPSDFTLKPEQEFHRNCPNGKGNYIAFVLDDDQYIYFQSGYIKRSTATSGNPEVLSEFTMETEIRLWRSSQAKSRAEAKAKAESESKAKADSKAIAGLQAEILHLKNDLRDKEAIIKDLKENSKRDVQVATRYQARDEDRGIRSSCTDSKCTLS